MSLKTSDWKLLMNFFVAYFYSLVNVALPGLKWSGRRRISYPTFLSAGTCFGVIPGQSQAKPVKRQHTRISPNHVPEAVSHSLSTCVVCAWSVHVLSPGSVTPNPICKTAKIIRSGSKKDGGKEKHRPTTDQRDDAANFLNAGRTRPH